MLYIAQAGGIALAVLLLVVLGVTFLVRPNQFKPQLEAGLGAALGRRVTVGSLSFSLVSGAVAAADLAISDDPAFGSAPFLRAKSLRLAVELRPLIFSRKLNVTGLTIDQPEVSLIQSPTGIWNFSTLGGRKPSEAKPPAAFTAPPAAPPAAPSPAPSPKTGLDLSVKLVRVAGGRFSVATAGARGKLENVDFELRDFSRAAQFPFSFSAKIASGGDIRLEGKAGPIDPADVAMSPVSATLDVGPLDLAAAGLAPASSGLSGLVSFNGRAQCAGGRVTLDAQLKAERLKLARNGTPARRVVEFDFSLEHDLSKRSGALRRGDILVGSSPASITGTYAQRGESMVLDMKFAGPRMPVPELAELLPPLGIALPQGASLEGGFASADFTVEGPADRLVANGSLGLSNTRLTNFDLGGKLAFVEKLAGIKGGPNTEIETLTADVRMAADGIEARNIHFVAPAIGELAGDGKVSPANTLDFKMRATAHTSGPAALLGKTAVPFVVEGSAANPVFKPDVKAAAAEEVKNVKEDAAGVLNNLLGRKKR